MMNSIEMADLGAAEIVVLAGIPESSRRAYEQMRKRQIHVRRDRYQRRPRRFARTPASRSDCGAARVECRAAIQVIAHPAAIAWRCSSLNVRKAGAMRRRDCEIFEPASERGQRGYRRTAKADGRGCFRSSRFPKKFTTLRSAFNMLPEYGSDSPHKLAAIELKIDRASGESSGGRRRRAHAVAPLDPSAGISRL